MFQCGDFENLKERVNDLKTDPTPPLAPQVDQRPAFAVAFGVGLRCSEVRHMIQKIRPEQEVELASMWLHSAGGMLETIEMIPL